MDLKCSPIDQWEQWFVADTLGGYLVQTSIREYVLSLFPNVRRRTGKKILQHILQQFTEIKRYHISSTSFFSMLGTCKVSPLLCPLMSSGNWSYRARRISKLHPKPYMGHKELWIKLGTSKCQSTLLFRNKAYGSYCKREVLGQKNRG